MMAFQQVGDPNGTRAGEVVADVHTATLSGVAIVDASGRVTLIRSDDGGAQGQAGGAFDGRYAVWKDYPTPANLDLFTVWMWDHSTGRTTKIGGSHGPTGEPFPSAWSDPVVGAGHATWTEGVDAEGAARVQVVDLASAAVWTASTGHPTPGAFVGGSVVWGEGPAPGARNVARAVNLTSREATSPPQALAREDGLFSLTSDGTAMAWLVQSDGGTSGPTTTVRYAATPSSEPRNLYALTVGGFNPPLTVHGAVVLGTHTQGSFVANGSTGASVTLTDLFGIQLVGDHVRITQNPKSDKTARTRRSVDVPVATLLPGSC